MTRLVRTALIAALTLAACGDKSATDAKKDASASAKAGGDKGAPPTTSSASAATSATAAAPPSNTPRLDYPNTDDGLKALLGEFTKPNAKPDEVLAKLKPDTADYEAAFDASAAKSIQEQSDKMFDKGGSGFKPDDAITIKASGSTEDFKEFKAGSPVEQGCPGGYRRVGPVMKPNMKFYCVKIGGTSLDAFAYVNGHWVLFPKPFRALKE